MKRYMKASAALLSAAMILQNAAMLPVQTAPVIAPIPAAAAEVKEIVNRIFEYNFGSFRLLYDTRYARWYDEKGVPVSERTSLVQNARFQGADVTVNFTNKTVTNADGSVNANLTKAFGAFFDISRWLPYAPTYYDKAQQKELTVPAPDYFPVTFIFDSESDDFVCDIFFGEKNACTLCYAANGADNAGYYKKTELNTIDTDGYTDPGDVNIDGDFSVSDAVLTARVVAEDKTTPISDLGQTLADYNTDGLIAVDDLTDELRVLSGAPARANAGISIVNQKSVKGDPNAPEMMEAANLLFGYRYNNALQQEIQGVDYKVGKVLRWSVDEGDEYDTLTLHVLARYSSGCDFALQGIEIDAAGKMTVRAGMYQGSDVMYDASFSEVLTVPHGTLPVIKDSELIVTNYREKWTETEFFMFPRKEGWRDFQASLPDELKIRVSADAEMPKQPAGYAKSNVQMTLDGITSFTQDDEDKWNEDAAALFGYEGEEGFGLFWNKALTDQVAGFAYDPQADQDALHIYLAAYGDNNFESRPISGSVDENGVLTVKMGFWQKNKRWDSEFQSPKIQVTDYSLHAASGTLEGIKSVVVKPFCFAQADKDAYLAAVTDTPVFTFLRENGEPKQTTTTAATTTTTTTTTTTESTSAITSTTGTGQSSDIYTYYGFGVDTDSETPLIIANGEQRAVFVWGYDDETNYNKGETPLIVKDQNPGIIRIDYYMGRAIYLKGIAVGETDLVITTPNGKTGTLHIVVGSGMQTTTTTTTVTATTTTTAATKATTTTTAATTK